MYCHFGLINFIQLIKKKKKKEEEEKINELSEEQN